VLLSQAADKINLFRLKNEILKKMANYYFVVLEKNTYGYFLLFFIFHVLLS